MSKAPETKKRALTANDKVSHHHLYLQTICLASSEIEFEQRLCVGNSSRQEESQGSTSEPLLPIPSVLYKLLTN